MAARSRRFEETSVYTWEVENYSTLRGEIFSPQFHFLDGSKWELVLKTGVFHNFSEHDVVCIRRTAPTSDQHRLDVRACVVDVNGARRHEQSLSAVCVTDGWNYILWSMDRPLLMDAADELLPNDRLVVQCRLGSEYPLVSECEQTETSLTGSALERLSSDLKHLFENAEHTDVTLKCGDKRIEAHRSILAARSEVFAAMFRHDMIEKYEGIVEIPDVESENLYKLLHYIYCSKIGMLTVELALRLYEVADKYAVETLKDECSVFLQRHLSILNACDVLVLADAHGDDGLKNMVVCFLLTNKQFLASNDWKEFCKKYVTLCNEVLLCFVEVNNEWEDLGILLS